MGFKILMSLFGESLKPTVNDSSLQEFMDASKHYQRRHLLIFCKDGDVARVKESAREDHHVYNNLSDRQTLKNLDALKLNAVLCVTDPQHMRGFDYRSPVRGINLLLMRKFDHERDLIQALWRVGRQSDPYVRFKRRGMNLIDELTNSRYVDKLSQAHSKKGRGQQQQASLVQQPMPTVQLFEVSGIDRSI